MTGPTGMPDGVSVPRQQPECQGGDVGSGGEMPSTHRPLARAVWHAEAAERALSSVSYLEAGEEEPVPAFSRQVWEFGVARAAGHVRLAEAWAAIASAPSDDVVVFGE